MESKADHNIIDRLQDEIIYNKLLQMINKSNYLHILRSVGPFTLLAPTDEAFKNLPNDAFNKILDDPEKLSLVLGQHTIIGYLESDDIAHMDELLSINNITLAVEIYEGGLIVGGAKIITSNIKCANGIIHAIDLVLLP